MPLCDEGFEVLARCPAAFGGQGAAAHLARDIAKAQALGALLSALEVVAVEINNLRESILALAAQNPQAFAQLLAGAGLGSLPGGGGNVNGTG